MPHRPKAYELWKQMQPAALRRLALAVFLVFSVMGPLTALMESELRLLSWKFIIIQTIASGSMAACIILFARRRWWVTTLVIVFWSAVIFMNSGGIGFIFDERGMRVEFTGTGSVKSAPRSTAEITLKPDELDAIYTQRSIIGAMAIALLASGYGVFISVIGKELEQRARLETEVKIARNIQQSLLPESPISTSWYSAAGVAVAATEVAGDFFDIIQLNDDRLAVAIADVTGHGVGAGILSAMTKSALRSQLRHDASPVSVLENLNATLYEVSGEKMFVTFAYVLVDYKKSSWTLATAGHPPVLFKHADSKTPEQFRTIGLGLGIQRQSAYASLQKNFKQGDTILMYTDGVVEAMNAGREQFGYERLATILASSDGSPVGICGSVTSGLVNFAGSKVFQDDVSLVCIKFT